MQKTGYKTLNKVVLGVDPGIRNTGLSLVSRKRNKPFRLLDSMHVETVLSSPYQDRLKVIYNRVVEMVTRYSIDANVDAIYCENVFFNKNVSSALSTAGVIGVVHLAGAYLEIPVTLIKPQSVKISVGAKFNADKEEMVRMVSLLMPGSRVTSHHLADSVGCAIAGILELEVFKQSETERSVV